MPTLGTSIRTYHARFTQGGYPTTTGFYGGTDNYGEAEQTYGGEAGETGLGGAVYIVLPAPGYRGVSPSWLYRANDTARQFRAVIGNRADLTDRLDVSLLASAELVLTETSFNGEAISRRAFALTTDLTNNELYVDFSATDLPKRTRYAVQIRCLFTSGRYMTIETDDEVRLEVLGSGSSYEGI